MATKWGEKNCTYVVRGSDEDDQRFEECDHMWEIDTYSGINSVEERDLSLKMQCEECGVTLWVKQTSTCEGYPMICRNCDLSESECECLWCDNCAEEKHDCICDAE